METAEKHGEHRAHDGQDAQHGQGQHHGHAEQHGHGGDDARWSDEAFVADWIERQEARAAERRPLFAKMRAVLPRGLDESFRYANIGAGPGNLDELILDRYTGAQAVLIDGSQPMLTFARKRLERFGDRAQFVTADVGQPGWLDAAQGPFDIVVAARAIHHAGNPDRIRQLFREIHSILAPGGVFINLDYVRFTNPVFQQLGVWSGEDPDASFQIATPHMTLPASLEDQLTWLREAGFAEAECVYREFQTVIVVAVRDEIRVPEGVKTE
jgi:tRNA (cmo5U34)-methyltransferase